MVGTPVRRQKEAILICSAGVAVLNSLVAACAVLKVVPWTEFFVFVKALIFASVRFGGCGAEQLEISA